ncbi:KAP family P-loop NTPase fold protein [Celeribacter halophilus]|uniref:KAP family P-loop NTPase fold protein n=1 Tax=Celeribacter halophilus TaxID=576117 RepID=UPI001C0875E5|nr:P-loop NTPase fold protein [Celeribacter halophilus]MBU2889021.1 KAP family NTPase [Celeribacter halophilus]MDO6510450.1 P-loop NTPase fold protein [Celeribacter halophilus]
MTAQRLTIPEPEIELYEDGFDATDRGVADLGRKEDGKKLSDLVEKIAEPMVIAVDAPWGAGKSVFLKCWVGAHTKENKGTATTVYFDAFQHDFLDDPLVSIFKEVTDRIEKLKPETTEDAEQQRIAKLKDLSGKAKKYVPILGRAALRLAVGTVATEAIMDIENPDESSLDELLQNANSEVAKAIGSFWNAEETRSQAMNGFREYLSDLAKDQKLVIVVDELDRCRPDYALHLLEVIKHFFNVENVHFVLGVNLTELENSVRARYGAGVNAGLYLQKFVTVRMRLGKPAQNGSFKTNYFDQLCDQLTITEEEGKQIAVQYIKQTANDENVTLRGMQQFGRHLNISPTAWHRPYYHPIGEMREEIRVGLIFLAAFYPKYISKVLNGEFDYATAVHLFQLPKPLDPQTTDMVPTFAWMACLGGSAETALLEKHFSDNTTHIRQEISKATIPQIWHEYVNVFQLPT